MPEHRVLFMPARIADIGTTIKVVSVPLLSGDTRGIPASTLVMKKPAQQRHSIRPRDRDSAPASDSQVPPPSRLRCRPPASIDAAVRAADCICCATSSTPPLFPSKLVRPGTHVVLVGSYKPEMAEVDTALIRRARAVVVVDSRAACAVEAGELIAAGVPQAATLEVGERPRRAPAGAEEGPRRDDIQDCRLGTQDIAIAVATVDRAMEMGIGTMVPDFE
ncbi:hypothetical protein EDB85DRAFT_2150133 [Lactarius pseudohatsudake]|nr:hypothetical protein EDB85DRAFT_2150133 [Lactarius pseudohatsudake]